MPLSTLDYVKAKVMVKMHLKKVDTSRKDLLLLDQHVGWLRYWLAATNKNASIFENLRDKLTENLNRLLDFQLLAAMNPTWRYGDKGAQYLEQDSLLDMLIRIDSGHKYDFYKTRATVNNIAFHPSKKYVDIVVTRACYQPGVYVVDSWELYVCDATQLIPLTEDIETLNQILHNAKWLADASQESCLYVESYTQLLELLEQQQRQLLFNVREWHWRIWRTMNSAGGMIDYGFAPSEFHEEGLIKPPLANPSMIDWSINMAGFVPKNTRDSPTVKPLEDEIQSLRILEPQRVKRSNTFGAQTLPLDLNPTLRFDCISTEVSPTTSPTDTRFDEQTLCDSASEHSYRMKSSK